MPSDSIDLRGSNGINFWKTSEDKTEESQYVTTVGKVRHKHHQHRKKNLHETRQSVHAKRHR